MNIHYKKEYAEPLSNRIKIHTIRAYSIPVGTELKHIVYPYTRGKRKCVLQNKCISVQKIRIIPGSDLMDITIYIDDIQLSSIQITLLSWNDGFNSLKDFCMYFKKPFKGFIIHWTDFRYK